MFNKGDFKRFLETGDRPCRQEPAEDATQAEAKTFLKKTLSEHDKVYHKDGYKEGDKCNFREAMKRNDIVDDILEEKPAGEMKLGLVQFREDGEGDKRIVDVVEVGEAVKEMGDDADEADMVKKYLSALEEESN